MKKLIFIAVAAIFAVPAMSQPVSDRSVIPVAVTLNRVLRLNVESGGNIEFVFNTVGQFATGINAGGASSFYRTRFTVAASTRWDLYMGAEDATFLGTDIAGVPNTMTLDNVGYSLTSNGANNVGTGAYTVGIGLDDVGLLVIGLPAFPFDMIVGAAPPGNGGDIGANEFDIDWRAGTMEPTMNALSILAQDVEPDRYVTNVLLDLRDAL